MPPGSSDAPYTALDLFCGVGGLSLGLAHSGFRLLGAVDLDQHALDTHLVNFPKVPHHKCDLYTTSGTVLRKALCLKKTRIDLLAGGPPCQGFSVGGVRTKKDPRNQGIMAFARLVMELRPRYFLMENVRGFLFRDHTALRNRFCREVRASGYVPVAEVADISSITLNQPPNCKQADPLSVANPPR